MDKALEVIFKNMINRYSHRLKQLGKDVKTLGWGTVDQQIFRFQQTLKTGVSFEDKRILDIGCGFGDYYKFLSHVDGLGFDSYVGYDINSELVEIAKKEYSNDMNCAFYVENILKHDVKEPIAEVGVMLGLLNLNLKGEFDNYSYTKQAVKNAFALVEECLIVDFLSTNITKFYPKEDFVFYHDPLVMLEYALTLSSNVQLNHSYAPIPQKEFMLYIYK